jgi:hypothetical protein
VFQTIDEPFGIGMLRSGPWIVANPQGWSVQDVRQGWNYERWNTFGSPAGEPGN